MDLFIEKITLSAKLDVAGGDKCMLPKINIANARWNSMLTGIIFLINTANLSSKRGGLQ